MFELPVTASTTLVASGVAVIAGALLLRSLRSRPHKVKGKVVLITGASSGIGEALAHEFHKAGAKVILCARNIQKLNEVKTSLESSYSNPTPPHVLYMDLEDADSLADVVNAAVAVHGAIDVLINNAGISFRGSGLDTSLDVYRRIMAVNYIGQIGVTQAVGRHMVERGSGTIVTISSLQGRFAIPWRTAYGASKHAIQSYMDSLRAELAHTGVKVLVVSPGYIKTNLAKSALGGDGAPAQESYDKNIENGMAPEVLAACIRRALESGAIEISTGPLHHRLAIVLRAIFPNLFAYVMAKRAKGDRH